MSHLKPCTIISNLLYGMDFCWLDINALRFPSQKAHIALILYKLKTDSMYCMNVPYTNTIGISSQWELFWRTMFDVSGVLCDIVRLRNTMEFTSHTCWLVPVMLVFNQLLFLLFCKPRIIELSKLLPGTICCGCA